MAHNPMNKQSMSTISISQRPEVKGILFTPESQYAKLKV
jgi:hypothetical protein